MLSDIFTILITDPTDKASKYVAKLKLGAYAKSSKDIAVVEAPQVALFRVKLPLPGSTPILVVVPLYFQIAK